MLSQWTILIPRRIGCTLEHSSKFRAKYIKDFSKGTMKIEYDKFQTYLDTQYGNITNFPLCFKNHPIYFEELY